MRTLADGTGGPRIACLARLARIHIVNKTADRDRILAGVGNPWMVNNGRNAPPHIPFETLLCFGIVLVVEGLDWSPKRQERGGGTGPLFRRNQRADAK